MIIIRLMGGLGNQMQQYALYRKFLSLGKESKLDDIWFRDSSNQATVLAPRKLELMYFRGLPMEFCTDGERRALVPEEGKGVLAKILAGTLARTRIRKSAVRDVKGMYEEDIFDLDNAYLVGYFACNKYYADILPELRKDFVFPENPDARAAARNRETMQRMEKENEDGHTLPVSIHFRRGDYLLAENSALLGGICTPEYYRGAVQYLKTRFSGRTFHFYLFSDDPDYAETLTFGDESDTSTVVRWNEGESSLLDIELMSRCRANICANSTFSFWGARLNPRDDAVRIRPLDHKNTQSASPEVMHSLWEGWVLADRQGNIV
jgi:hypothetical protein